jgi:hypothetical protein
MPMSNYQIFERIRRLGGYAARSTQLDIGVAIQRLLTRKAPAPQSEASLRSEAEYYSLIAGEVSRLPNNTHVARQALYDRTWVAIVAQLLHGQDPRASDPQVASEHLAFQRAICKVEVEMAIGMANGNAQEKEPREQVQEKRRRPF